MKKNLTLKYGNAKINIYSIVPKKNYPKNLSFRYFATFLPLFVVFITPILVHFIVKPQGITNTETKAVAIENNVVLEPVANKIVKELLDNGNFSEFSNNKPANWSTYSPSNSESLTLSPISDKQYTYVNDSSLLMQTTDTNNGIEQKFPSGLSTPVFFQANVLVESGKFKLVILDKAGQEIAGDETTDDKIMPEGTTGEDILPYWQRLAVGITDPDVVIGSIRLISTEPYSTGHITNVVSHPYADYTELFSELSTDSNKKYISDCDEKNEEEYRQCIIAKTSLEPDRWNEVGIPKMYYKDSEVSLNQLSFGNSQKSNSIYSLDTSGIKQYNVKYIYFATDFINKSDPSNPTKFQKQIKEFIQNGWKGEVTKEIRADDAIIKPFDPTIKSECKITGYWSKATAYFPDTWCSDDPELQYAFLRAGGGDGQYQFEKPRIYVDTNGNWSDLEYTIKHETGHFDGSPDSDFVEVRGNSLFKDGNSKRNSIWADLMYLHTSNLSPSEYTVGVINNVDKFSRDNFYKFQPRNLIIKNAKTKEPIQYGRYNIYDGIAGPPHYKGFIWPNLFRNTGEIMEGVITSNEPPFLQEKYGDVAGFLKIESDGKLFIGKFDLVDLTLAYLRGQDSLEVLVDQVGEGNVAILNPENDAKINSLDDIKIKVLPPTDSNLTNWTLSARVNGETLSLTSGKNIMSGEQINIPLENISRFYMFNGNIDLVLEAKFSTGEHDSGINDAINGSMREISLSDKKSNINLQDKIEITSVKIISRNNVLIDGKGFGNSPTFITVYEPLTRRYSKYTDTYGYETNEMQYNYTLRVQNDHVEGFLGDKPYFESKTFTPENWADKILDITILRINAQSEIYHYYPSGLGNPSSPMVLSHPPSRFDYDPPEVSSETLTNHFEIKCPNEGTKIIFGVETTDNILNHKYIETRNDCNYNEPIVRDFILENTDAEKLWESAKYGNYYWFVCQIRASKDPSLYEGSYTQDQISKMLSADDSENIYTCDEKNMGNIVLSRRVYDITPIPTPIPLESSMGSVSTLCEDGSVPSESAGCPTLFKNASEKFSTTTEEDTPTSTPTPDDYYFNNENSQNEF